MWFKKEKNLTINEKYGFIINEINENFIYIKKLETKISALEIDMRFLQDKFKSKIFKKESNENTETNKNTSPFLNPYGNPI